MQSINIEIVIITSALFIALGFVLWNGFAPEASRAAYTGIFGPGGLFGLLLPRSIGRHSKNAAEKGMAPGFMAAIIMLVIVATIIVLFMTGFLGESGPVVSSLGDDLFDFGAGRIA